MKNSHLKDSLVAALIAVFAGVSTLGVNVALGEVPAGALPANTNLVAPTFSGLNVKGNISNSDAAVNGGVVMINDNLSVSGDSTKTNALDAWGLTTIHNALDVIGITTLESNIKIGGSISNSNPGIPVNIDGPAGLKISGNNAGNAGIEIKDPDGGSIFLTSSKEGALGKMAIIGAVAMDAVSITNLSVSSSANFLSPTLQIIGNIYNSAAPGGVEQPVKIIDDLSIGNASLPANLYNLYVSGNVGLGATPTANRLEVNGALKSTSAIITGLSAGGPVVADATGLLKIGAAATPLWTASLDKISNTNTGNVGIGTATPTDKLHVSQSSSGSFSGATIENTNAANAAYTFLNMANDNSAINKAGLLRMSSTNPNYSGPNSLALIQQANAPIGFITGNTLRMIIDGLGYVGIGTSAGVIGSFPSTMLDVNGDITARSILNVTGLIKARGGISNDMVLAPVKIDDDLNVTGKVGIGTASPTDKLHVSQSFDGSGGATIENTSAGASAYSYLKMVNNTNDAAHSAGLLRMGGNNTNYSGKDSLALYTQGAYPIGFITNNALQMIISATGNVGVGTSNPWQGKVVSVSPGGFDNLPSFLATTMGLATSEKSYYSMYSSFGSGNDFNPRRTADMIAGFDGGTWGKEFLTLNVGNSGNSGDLLPGSVPMPTAEKVRIQGNGNVGIGTPTPTSNFVVSQPVRGIGKVTTQQDTALYGAGTQFTNTFKIGDSITVCDGATLDNGGCNGTSETRAISAIPSDTELTVSVAFTMSKGNLKYTVLGSGDRLAVKGNGNVGVGTTTPIAPLDVKTGNVTPSTQIMIRGGSGAASDQGVTFATDGGTDVVGKIGHLGTKTGLWSFDMWTDEFAPLTFWNASTEKMRITDNGNVGIGTKTPGAKLDVVQTGGGAGSFTALNLTAGNDSNYFSNNQITLGYNGTSNYRHAIQSRHNSNATIGNAIDFYVWNQATQSASPSAVGTKRVMTLDGDGSVTMPSVYATTVTTGTRALYIDNTGKIGGLNSSQRFKENIKSLDDVSWLYSLRPVFYNYIEDKTKTKKYGLIAEEVDKVNPSIVSRGNDGRIDAVFYEELFAPMLKAIQDQKSEIDQLKAENAEIKAALCEIKPTLKLCR